MRPSLPRRKLYSSLLKLALIVAGILGSFHLLFDVAPSNRNEIRTVALNVLPGLKQPRNPGPRIIFRLDDVEKGVREQQVFDLLALFQRRDVPVDLGIVPHAGGNVTYDIPGVKTYLSRGVADISLHGVTHRDLEFHTAESGISKADLRDGLKKAKTNISEYYGVEPVAFLVPYDVFDKAGYQAVREAGFRILSSQWQTDEHRGTRPVGFESNPASPGLYRLPAVDDAVAWDPERRQWGEFQPLSNLLFSVRASLDTLGVAVLSLHPAAFADEQGRTDREKMEVLDALITRVGELGRVVTFRNWYCTYAADDEPERAESLCP